MYANDQELVNDLKVEGKKEKAFSELVVKYQERLYWHIRKMVLNHDDADDVLQNTFIKVWRNIDNFREESSLFTWLYRIATNETLTFVNSRKRRTMSQMEDINDQLAQQMIADEHFDGDAIQIKLQRAILSLPEKQRLVFNMRYFDEMPYQEMSDILETSVGALKASYHHAAKKIEEFFRGNE